MPTVCLLLCLSGLVSCYFETGRKVLPSGGSSHVSSLACQRTRSLWLCPFTKFTSSAVNSTASRTLAGGWTLKSWTESLCSLVELDCCDLGRKKHKDGQNMQAKQDMRWEVSIPFLPPLLFAVVGCFTVHILVLMQCLLTKYCELFCKWNVLR